MIRKKKKKKMMMMMRMMQDAVVLYFDFHGLLRRLLPTLIPRLLLDHQIDPTWQACGPFVPKKLSI
jgi:hypothetical protein